MKKMLVLALVLAVAGLANAGLTLTASKSTLALNEVATFTLSSDVGGKGFLLYAIVREGGKGAVTAPVVSTGDPALNAVKAYTEAGFGTGYEVTLANGVVNKVVAGNFMTFTFSSAIQGTANVAVYDDALGYNAPAASVAMTIVPEPMTMVLLGLGGLFLRKKK